MAEKREDAKRLTLDVLDELKYELSFEERIEIFNLIDEVFDGLE